MFLFTRAIVLLLVEIIIVNIETTYIVIFFFRCKALITKRQIEKNSDFRLNIELQKACRLDMPKFCKEIMDNAQGQDEEIEGKMLNCLKQYFPKNVSANDVNSQRWTNFSLGLNLDYTLSHPKNDRDVTERA